MSQYGSFARVYDMFMDNIPYEDWCHRIVEILKEHGIDKGIVADLGCGTGRLTKALSDKGFDMIGIDMSPDMLDIAIDKRGDADILYLCQDMREFELYGTVAAIVSVCDSLNYITEEEDLLEVFKLVNNYLDPEGIFIFDMNTPYKYKKILANNTFAESREDAAFIWENFYDTKTRINEYDLTLFIREDDIFERYEECHLQRSYDLDRIKDLIAEAGLVLLDTYDGFTGEEPGRKSERVCFVCKESGKEG
ncbi:MAG: class I SAM-dependent methyltransferase [Lachnospiraceae bacterium]|nr:class I SAM-dependent methyltransferase [Lachnospiraceae bacterium]